MPTNPVSSAPTCTSGEWKLLHSAPHIPAGQPASHSAVLANYQDGDFIYFSHGYGDIKKYSLSSGTVVAENNKNDLVFEGRTCNYSFML